MQEPANSTQTLDEFISFSESN
ncbi:MULTISPECIES: hypothetical protein [Symbiopectobacterium]|nr:MULTISPECIES: hypothetical protein [Symbiopectobacterium]